MGEDELVWKGGEAPMLRGSGSGGDGEGENAPFSIPPHPQHQPSHQHFFFNDHEIASWPHHHIFYTQPQNSVFLVPPPPPSVPYDPPPERLTGQFFTTEENLSNLRGNIITGAGPWIPVVRESTQVGLSSAIEYPLVPVMESTETRLIVTGVVSQTFVVPGLDRKEKTVVIETEQIQIQPADDTKQEEREGTEETEEAPASTSSRKRSRAAEMHNLAARRRREKINNSMKDLQELIPRSNKSDKVSVLEDAVQFMKSLQMQIQMMSTGCSIMPPTDTTPNMQPHMAMGMNRPPFIPFPGTPPPFPSQSHMAGLGPAYPPPHYPFPTYDPSRIYIPPSQQPNPVWNQPQFPGYMNPYSQFVGLQQMQQPPPLQNQTASQLSLGQASGSREHEDQENQPSGE